MSMTIVDDAKTTIADRQAEIEAIITQAREASAAAGAAIFTQDFKNESKDLADRATSFRIGSLVLLILLLKLRGILINPCAKLADPGM